VIFSVTRVRLSNIAVGIIHITLQICGKAIILSEPVIAKDAQMGNGVYPISDIFLRSVQMPEGVFIASCGVCLLGGSSFRFG